MSWNGAGDELHRLPSLLRLFAAVLRKQLPNLAKLRGGSMRSKSYGLNMTIVNLIEQIGEESQEAAREKLRGSEQWRIASPEQRLKLSSKTDEPFWRDIAELLNRLLPDDACGISFSAESLKEFYRREQSPY
jgi:hypothetical protein